MPTLAEFVTRTLDRAGMTNAQVPVTARVEEYVNDALADLDRMLTARLGHEYRAASVDIEIHNDIATAVGGGALSLAGWRDILSVHINFADGSSRPIESFEHADRDRKWYGYASRGSRVRYHKVGTELQFEPADTADGLTGKVRYSPSFTAISGATVYVAPDRLEEYAVLSAAIRLRSKARQDNSDLEAELSRLRGYITTEMPAINRGAAPHFVRRARW